VANSLIDLVALLLLFLEDLLLPGLKVLLLSEPILDAFLCVFIQVFSCDHLL